MKLFNWIKNLFKKVPAKPLTELQKFAIKKSDEEVGLFL